MRAEDPAPMVRHPVSCALYRIALHTSIDLGFSFGRLDRYLPFTILQSRLASQRSARRSEIILLGTLVGLGLVSDLLGSLCRGGTRCRLRYRPFSLTPASHIPVAAENVRITSQE
jgi:hypothetical protein